MTCQGVRSSVDPAQHQIDDKIISDIPECFDCGLSLTYLYFSILVAAVGAVAGWTAPCLPSP